MKIFLTALLMTALSVAQGCSGDAFRRATYHSLQNMARQQCLKDPSADCPERESYEEYQQKREEVKRGG